jgi:hypothetical protein
MPKSRFGGLRRAPTELSIGCSGWRYSLRDDCRALRSARRWLSEKYCAIRLTRSSTAVVTRRKPVPMKIWKITPAAISHPNAKKASL